MKNFDILIGILLLNSCTKKDWNEQYQPPVMNTTSPTRISGIIQTDNEMLINGTHLIKGYFPDSLTKNNSQTKTYVLQSENIMLNKYKGKKVIVIGKMKEGYPVDYGKYYMEVSQINIEK